MTDQIDAFTASVREHLQPLFNDFMTLKVWAHLCVAEHKGNDAQMSGWLTNKLPGFAVDRFTVEITDFTDTWTARLFIALSVELKDHSVCVHVSLSHATITDITLGEEPMPDELDQIDLVKEFERKQFMIALSK